MELECIVCKTVFIGEEPERCCDGRECGCMGLPIDPVVCSEECFKKLFAPKPQINNPNIYEI